MVWKPKERELTREEALEEARVALAPFWYHSKPLFMGSPTPEGIKIFPIENPFAEESWFVALLDPFSPIGTQALRYAKKLTERHFPHRLDSVLIFRSPHEFARDRTTIEALLEREKIRIATCLDSDGTLHSGFSVSDLEGVSYRVLDRGECKISEVGYAAPPQLERGIQEFLRHRDPGLALRPLLETSSWQGSSSQSKVSFPSGPSSVSGLQFSGSWRDERGRRVASGDDAAFEISVIPGRIHLLAESLGKNHLAAEIRVQINGGPVYQELRGLDLEEADAGRTAALVRYASLLELLKASEKSTSSLWNLRIEFPHAQEVPVAIYSLFTEA